MHDDNEFNRSAPRLGEILVSSRSLAEYRAMFSLTENELNSRILDCPGGAASLTGEVNKLGGEATACDSAYFDATPADLAEIAINEAGRGNAFVHNHRHDYVWTYYSDPDHHQRIREDATGRFCADINDHPEQYVPGRLPSLPFGDDSFDLVLSSHLLFSYSDVLDHRFHVDSIAELMRVSRGEVRIFPLVAVGESTPYPRLGELRENLVARGINSRIVEVDYEFQRGADEMLVCTQPSTPPASRGERTQSISTSSKSDSRSSGR